MKTIVALIALFAVSNTAAAASLVYRFEVAYPSSGEWFELLMDFSPDFRPDLDSPDRVYSAEEFIALADQGLFPTFIFGASLYASNFDWCDLTFRDCADYGDIGFSSLVADERPLATELNVNGLGNLLRVFDPLNADYFPTNWLPGIGLDWEYSSPLGVSRSFYLTSIREVPLPSALPLFLVALSTVAYRRRTAVDDG